MSLRPSCIEEIQEALSRATADRQRLQPLDLARLDRLIEHKPEDLTCTVECGMTLARLQDSLAASRQWLPLDPPHARHLSIRDLIDGNFSGPRRLGFGTVRDYLIGLEVILADGSRIRSGGRVVKNVAGYDLHKLFVGSHGILGIPAVATFKLFPMPEAEVVLRATRPSAPEAAEFAVVARDRLPCLVALDVHRFAVDDVHCDVTAQFAGTAAGVARQRDRAVDLGFELSSREPWDERLWQDPQSPPSRFSVVVSGLAKALEALGHRRFIARVGSGMVYHDGPPEQTGPGQPRFLMERFKAAFDPAGILPPLLE